MTIFNLKLFRNILVISVLLLFYGCTEEKTDKPKNESRLNQLQPPHLEKQGTAARLVVENKPFLLISGELHNSTCGGLEYMRPVWKQMAQKNLNSLIAPVSWELVEPVKGKFDFGLVDSIISGARKANLKLVLIWFGSWKNSGSVYIPAWVKNDYEKYPRVKDENGKPLEILSTFAEASCEADAEAFTALMRHIKEIDSSRQTVVMVQVENEIGILDHMGETPGNARRDFSDRANAAFMGQVPKELMDYLTAHKEALFPELYKVWSRNGFKVNGTWEEVFGKGELKPDKKDWQFYSYYTEELFMAWNYARYVGKIAEMGKTEYPLPMYVNAWLKQPDTAWPGRYPSGGPLPEVIDVWRAAAPSIDFISPDIYIDEYEWVCKEFTRSSNPLFIPETRGGAIGAARAFYTFGEFSAGCFAPFGIDEERYRRNDPLDDTYSILQNMAPIILENQGKGSMRGIIVDSINPESELDMGDWRIKAVLSSQANPRVAGGIIIKTASDEFIVAGKGLEIFFYLHDSSMRPGIETADEGIFNDTLWVPERRLNGDETHASTYDGTGVRFIDQKPGIQKVKLYRYK
jgi:beta-galactosidase GanA